MPLGFHDDSQWRRCVVQLWILRKIELNIINVSERNSFARTYNYANDMALCVDFETERALEFNKLSVWRTLSPTFRNGKMNFLRLLPCIVVLSSEIARNMSRYYARVNKDSAYTSPWSQNREYAVRVPTVSLKNKLNSFLKSE